MQQLLIQTRPFRSKDITSKQHKKYRNRKFRKGDKVRAVEYKGRKGTDCPDFTGEIYTVSKDEESNKLLKLTDDIFVYYIDPAYVKLITPIEEQEPYCVRKYSSFYAVEKHNNIKDRPATYDIDFHPNAEKAAEAERDRLNAEHRQATINN